MKASRFSVFVFVILLFMAAAVGMVSVRHQRHVRLAAEEGLRREISDNSAGVQEMRNAIPQEMKNISATVEMLEKREAGQKIETTPAKLGLAVMSFTNASWQAAAATGALRLMDFDEVQRFAGAYFEQARLAELQTSTLEAMMSLTSYIGQGEKIPSMSPLEARTAEIQAQAVLAHLRTMSRMTDGVDEAFKLALAS